MSVVRKKKIAKIVGAIIFLIMLVIIIVSLVATGHSQTRRIQDQLELGQRYLLDMNYEQAIVIFEAVIVVNPQNIDAYIGLIDAYAQSGDYISALSVAERAYETTGDVTFLEMQDEYREIISLQNETDENVPVENNESDVIDEDDEIQGLAVDSIRYDGLFSYVDDIDGVLLNHILRFYEDGSVIRAHIDAIEVGSRDYWPYGKWFNKEDCGPVGYYSTEDNKVSITINMAPNSYDEYTGYFDGGTLNLTLYHHDYPEYEYSEHYVFIFYPADVIPNYIP